MIVLLLRVWMNGNLVEGSRGEDQYQRRFDDRSVWITITSRHLIIHLFHSVPFYINAQQMRNNYWFMIPSIYIDSTSKSSYFLHTFVISRIVLRDKTNICGRVLPFSLREGREAASLHARTDVGFITEAYQL